MRKEEEEEELVHHHHHPKHSYQIMLACIGAASYIGGQRDPRTANKPPTFAEFFLLLNPALLGAFPPVDFRAVCFVRAMF